MTEDAIVAELADVCGLLNATHARLVALVGEVLQGECWAGAGIHSCEQWVSWRTGLSPARAGQVVTMARRRVDLPETFAAFEAGELSVDQVAVVARHTPAPYDHDVASFARAATVVQLRRTLGRYRFGDDAADPVERPDPIHVSRRCDDDGHYRLSARLDADDGAVVDAALEEAHDALFNAGDVDATWSDALVEMARRSLGAVSSLARRDSFTVYLHLPTDHGHAYLHGGPALPDALARQLLCDSRGAIVGLRNSTPVNVGRTRRIVPSHTRRTVEDRDRGCRVPGCTRRHGEIHHIVHWLDHGPTDTANLVVLCHRHHRLHHQGGLGIQGNADQPGGLAFTDRRGRPVPRAPAPTAPTVGCTIPVAGIGATPPENDSRPTGSTSAVSYHGPASRVVTIEGALVACRFVSERSAPATGPPAAGLAVWVKRAEHGRAHPARKAFGTMAAVCELCGKGPSWGMSVSHSHRRTKRRWNPNIQRVRAVVDGTPKRLYVCTSCIKAGKVVKPARTPR